MRELQALVAPTPPQGVLVHGHAGLVINLSLLPQLAVIAVTAALWTWRNLNKWRTPTKRTPIREAAAAPGAGMSAVEPQTLNT